MWVQILTVLLTHCGQISWLSHQQIGVIQLHSTSAHPITVWAQCLAHSDAP